MICPKCGFEQPDDMYCAFCGVNIERYSRRQKKRRYKVGILALLVGIAGLSVASLLTSSHKNKIAPDDEVSQANYAEMSPRVDQTSRLGQESRGSISRPRDRGKRRSDVGPSGRSSKDAYEGDGLGDDGLGVEEASLKVPLQRGKQQGKSGDDLDGEINSAAKWFEKGRALDDDSEAEIQFYERAIKKDPAFAPAHYRLGAIFYRQANYELADEEFASFLKYASDADRAAFNIYEYYSLRDVDRLFDRVDEQAPSEQEKDETTPETEKEIQPKSSEETSGEASEGVMTIVRFSSVNGHITVPVVLNGFLTAKVLVDTGAGITIISRDLAGELGLDKTTEDSITLKTMAMDIEAQMAKLDSIQVGELTRHSFPVAITDLSLGERTQFAGILGMDFLNHYKIHIDNDSQRIRLTPRAR